MKHLAKYVQNWYFIAMFWEQFFQLALMGEIWPYLGMKLAFKIEDLLFFTRYV
jgi:hypothetical protein